MKRIADLLAASILLLITLPLIGAVAAAIKYDTPGPVFVRYKRRGANGRPVNVLKFRTTANQADRSFSYWNELTRVGDFLHYTRIEDLPGLQLPLLEEGNVSTYHADDFRQVLYSRVVKEVPYPRQLIPVRERSVCLVRRRAEFQHVYIAPVCASAFIANEHRTGCITFD